MLGVKKEKWMERNWRTIYPTAGLCLAGIADSGEEDLAAPATYIASPKRLRRLDSMSSHHNGARLAEQERSCSTLAAPNSRDGLLKGRLYRLQTPTQAGLAQT